MMILLQLQLKIRLSRAGETESWDYAILKCFVFPMCDISDSHSPGGSLVTVLANHVAFLYLLVF